LCIWSDGFDKVFISYKWSNFLGRHGVSGAMAQVPSSMTCVVSQVE